MTNLIQFGHVYVVISLILTLLLKKQHVLENRGVLIVEMANPNSPYDFFKKILKMKTWGDYYHEYDYFHMLRYDELKEYGKVTGEARFLPRFFDNHIRDIPFFWHTMILEKEIQK